MEKPSDLLSERNQNADLDTRKAQPGSPTHSVQEKYSLKPVTNQEIFEFYDQLFRSENRDQAKKVIDAFRDSQDPRIEAVKAEFERLEELAQTSGDYAHGQFHIFVCNKAWDDEGVLLSPRHGR